MISGPEGSNEGLEDPEGLEDAWRILRGQMPIEQQLVTMMMVTMLMKMMKMM